MTRPPVNCEEITFLTRQELFGKVGLSDFCGIGPRIERRLNAIGIYTPYDLTATDRLTLLTEFGHHSGTKLYLMGQGIDYSAITIQEELPPEKSFGHSYTMPKDHGSFDEAMSVLSRLSDQVARRMRKAGFLARTISAHLQLGQPTSTPGVEVDHQSIFGQMTLQNPINDGRQLFTYGLGLLTNELERQGDWPPHPHRPVIRVGITATNLASAPTTMPLFPADQRQEKLITAIDQLWNRYGSWSIVRANQLTASRILEDIPDGRTKRPIIR